MGAKIGWKVTPKNTITLEGSSGGAGNDATRWVHFDVSKFEPQYKAGRYYASTQGAVDNGSIVDIAKRESKFATVSCGGILPAPLPKEEKKTDRLNIQSLKLSKDGIHFIQSWEGDKGKVVLKPYDDAKGFATIGWGRLIAGKKSCAQLAGTDAMKPYKNGITKEQADAMLEKDISKAEYNVRSTTNVPLYQHEFDALVSLAFNTGKISFPNLLRNLNNKNYNGCCEEFRDITNDGLPGLVKRRNDEMNMFRHNIYKFTH